MRGHSLNVKKNISFLFLLQCIGIGYLFSMKESGSVEMSQTPPMNVNIETLKKVLGRARCQNKKDEKQLKESIEEQYAQLRAKEKEEREKELLAEQERAALKKKYNAQLLRYKVQTGLVNPNKKVKKKDDDLIFKFED